MARDRLSTTLWALAAVAAGLWLLARLETVVVPLLVGWFIAYALDPLLDRLEARRIPRAAGILILLTFASLLAVLAVVVVIPALVEQVRDATRALPGYVAAARSAWLPRLEAWLGRPLPADPAQGLSELLAAVGTSLPDLGTKAAAVAGRVVANLWSLVGTLLGLALIPVFAFYLLLDFNGLGERLVGLVPLRHQALAGRVLDRADEALGAFVRGQITVCAALALVYSVGLTLTGIDMPWVVGGLAGALFIVPYLGTLVGVVLASLLALLKFHDLAHLLAVWGVFAAGQALEGFLLTPRLVGNRVGLHPVAVIVAVLAGGELFGVVGVLLAVPAAAVLRVGLSEGLALYRASAWYREGT
ncbi:AI-2E family transporter [Deferrisoma palaeochoriense]